MKMLIFISILLSGLVAGLLYSYSCSVNPGLNSLPDVQYITAMQSINRAIQNPVFFIAFIGLLIFLPVATYQMRGCTAISFHLFIAATIIYFVGVFGVTMFCNVPLNNMLAKFSLSASNTNDVSAMRLAFEKPWNMYHFIRTIAAIISFSLTIIAVLKQKI